jgi:hypothetical protein
MLTALLVIRVLIPIYFEHPVAGAYGSLWQSQFAIHNSSLCSYTIEWCSPLPDLGCLLVGSEDAILVRDETQTALPGLYPKPVNGVAGAVIYIDGDGDPSQHCGTIDDVEDLSFQLRIADSSRSGTNAGTEIPVVREKSFRTAPLQLLDVPADDRFRLVLRLFEMNLDRAGFAIRVFDQATNALLSRREITTSTPPQGKSRFQPGFAEVVDLATPQAGFVRVEVAPLTPGSAFWAYVSVTSNESQQVTLVTPQ